MIGQSGEHIGEPGLRIDLVEPGCLDQGVHECGAVAAAPGDQQLGDIATGEPVDQLAAPPVRQIAVARLAASFRSTATASMLGVLEETAGELGPEFTPTG